MAWSGACERRGTVGPRASGSTSCTWTQSTSWTRRPCRPSAHKQDAGVANGHGESSKGARGKGYGKGTKGHRERGNGSRERDKGSPGKGRKVTGKGAKGAITVSEHARNSGPLPRVLAPSTLAGPVHACWPLPRVLGPSTLAGPMLAQCTRAGPFHACWPRAPPSTRARRFPACWPRARPFYVCLRVAQRTVASPGFQLAGQTSPCLAANWMACSKRRFSSIERPMLLSLTLMWRRMPLSSMMNVPLYPAVFKHKGKG